MRLYFEFNNNKWNIRVERLLISIVVENGDFRHFGHDIPHRRNFHELGVNFLKKPNILYTYTYRNHKKRTTCIHAYTNFFFLILNYFTKEEKEELKCHSASQNLIQFQNQQKTISN